MATETALPPGPPASAATLSPATRSHDGRRRYVGRDKITTNIQQLYERALSAAEASEQERDFELKRLAQGVGELVQRLQGQRAARRRRRRPAV